jgi:hypothetical protein
MLQGLFWNRFQQGLYRYWLTCLHGVTNKVQQTLSAQSSHSFVEQILFACFVMCVFISLIAVCPPDFLGNKLCYIVNGVTKRNE